MNKYEDEIKLDIFKAPTTYQNDYRVFPLDCRVVSSQNNREIKQEVVKKTKPYVRRDNETFAATRPHVHIPFNLLWRRKEITSTDPYEPFNTPVIPESVDKEEAIKTRPRIYMSPALSIDDIEDKEVRELIVDYMYTSEWTKAIQESAVQATKRHIANTTAEKSGDPVRLQIDLLPPLPDAFRKIGKDWENKQLKYTVDPTKTFWEYKDPPVKCGACSDPVEGLVPEDTKRQISELISEDKLRLVHDAPIPGYAGYKPRFSGGVSLAKVDTPIVHPYMSVSQAITKRYVADRSK